MTERRNCKYWTNWYCMLFRKFVITKEGIAECLSCKEFKDRNVLEKKTRKKK